MLTRVTARRIRARIAAGLLVAVLVTLPLAGPATAGALDVEIYDSVGIGRALEFQFTIEPSIFTPLAQMGIGYSESNINSRGGGTAYTLVSPTFPGKFAVGALGCLGGKGWVQAKYPAAGGCASNARDNFTRYPREGNDALLTAEVGGMTARAALGGSHGSTTIAHVELRPGDPAAAPFLSAAGIRTTTDADLSGNAVTHRVRTQVEDLRIALGDIAITVGSVESTALTRSNGTTAQADTSFVVSGVEVTVAGVTRRARIDQDGVHIDDPSVRRDIAAELDRQIDAALDVAGVTISISGGDEIVEGPSADASVGGLFLRMTAQMPPVRYPPEAAPILSRIIDAIPTSCFYDLFPPPLNLPLCFGAGVLPGPGTPMSATLAIASVQSRAIGILGDPEVVVHPTFEDHVVDPADDPLEPPSFTDGTAPAGGGPTAGPTQGRPRGPVTILGLVARMPSGALAGAGAALTLLAFAFVVAPSLRP